MNKDTRIIVNKKDLLNTLIEVAEEHGDAVEITIGNYENYDTGEYERCIAFAVLECGGAGCCADFDRIREMTPLEIACIE